MVPRCSVILGGILKRSLGELTSRGAARDCAALWVSAEGGIQCDRRRVQHDHQYFSADSIANVLV